MAQSDRASTQGMCRAERLHEPRTIPNTVIRTVYLTRYTASVRSISHPYRSVACADRKKNKKASHLNNSKQLFMYYGEFKTIAGIIIIPIKSTSNMVFIVVTLH